MIGLDDLLAKEMKGCFDYFWEEANPKNGIVRDNTDERLKDFGSIAATGFALAAYVVGVEKGYVSYDEAYERACNTLKAHSEFETKNGFFYHFMHLKDGSRYNNCEASIIDTAILLCGMIVCSEYFGGEITDMFEAIYEKVNWDWLLNKDTNRFYMGYQENRGGIIPVDWNHYAEQFIMYFLGVGSPTHSVDPSIFYSFERWKVNYGGHEYIRSGPNSLFVYQFSHAFIDFRNTVDLEGVDWFQNSVNATLAHRQYCIDNKENSKTYSKDSWGLSACHFKHGYSGGFGAEPYGEPGALETHNTNDGTIAVYAAISSITFTPEHSISAMKNFARYDELCGKYGFKESYNLDETPEYFDPLYLGIDKGITLLQIANYENGLIWKYFMKNKHIQKAMELIGIKPKK